jgi:cysteine desulfurase
MNKRVYLDYAATTPLDPQVLEAMLPYLKEKFGNPSSIHSFGQEARAAIDEVREKVAQVLNCQPQEIIFTSCATEANNLAIKGVNESMSQRVKETTGKVPHLIISPIEHHCVLDAAKHLEKIGAAEVTWLPVDKYGLVDPEDVEKSIKENTILVSVVYVNNEVGTVEPIAEIGRTLKKLNEESRMKNEGRGIYFHTDAVQAIQYLSCDVQKLGVDLLSLSAHKFYGPKGVGALYIKKGTPMVRQQDGGEQEYGLRAGTENTAGIVGLGAAIESTVNRKSLIVNRIEKLRDKLIDGVLKIADVLLTGHPEKRAPHIASFVVEGAEGEPMLLMLNEEGIAASSGSACTSGLLEPSHVLTAMGISAELAHGSLRLSLGKQTTEEEIDYVLEKLPKIVERLRSIAPE